MRKMLLILFCMCLSFKGEATCECERFFLTLGWGYSWSTRADLDVDLSFWDPTPDGYNANLSSTEVYTAGLGWYATNLFALGVEVSYRPEFNYEKFQSAPPGPPPGIPGFIGPKTRHFKLSNWSYMANVFLNKQACFLAYQWGCVRIAPFIGGGIGIAYNTVKDFHSIAPNPPAAFNAARSIMPPHTETAFAAQGMVGLVAKISERLSFELGYRRFHGGKFNSNDYLLDRPIGFDFNPQVPRWHGDLNANEIFLNLNLDL